MLLTALLCYGAFAVWRVFPRFDSRLIGQWRPGVRSEDVWVFHDRGAGEWVNVTRVRPRKFRWFTCGNVLVKHEDRGSRSANMKAALEYAVRTLLFLGPPDGTTEFDIVQLNKYGAQFVSRARPADFRSSETLVLRPLD